MTGRLRIVIPLFPQFTRSMPSARTKCCSASTAAPGPRPANALNNQASAKFQEGNHAGPVSDNYVRITVFLAAVLFLVGIGSTFKLHGVRYALIALGSVLLIVTLVLILHQPVLPS